MDLWTVLTVWCLLSAVLAPLVGRFLSGGSGAQTEARVQPKRVAKGLARDVAVSA